MITYVYTVHGSEDGILGAYSSRKRAIHAALTYLQQNGETAKIDSESPYYIHLVIANTDPNDYGGTTVDIERFILNA